MKCARWKVLCTTRVLPNAANREKEKCFEIFEKKKRQYLYSKELSAFYSTVKGLTVFRYAESGIL